MISYYSFLKLWPLPINSIEVILRISHWRRSGKRFEYVLFFKTSNLQRYSCICVQNLRKMPVKKFNFSKVADLKPATLMKNWTLLQLQNRFFVEHLPVTAYVRCLKEKEWKKWNSVFSLYPVWHSSLWHCKVQSGK